MKMEELVLNEQFVEKVEAAKTEEEIKEVFTEYGVEGVLDYSEDGEELSEEALDLVSGGGAISAAFFLKACAKAWKCGAAIGVITRAYYDAKKYGNTLKTYSKKDINNACKQLGLSPIF